MLCVVDDFKLIDEDLSCDVYDQLVAVLKKAASELFQMLPSVINLAYIYSSFCLPNNRNSTAHTANNKIL